MPNRPCQLSFVFSEKTIFIQIVPHEYSKIHCTMQRKTSNSQTENDDKKKIVECVDIG